MKIQLAHRVETIISFTYERLPNFCYWYGRLRHIMKYCDCQYEEGFNDKQEHLPFGPWLRATTPSFLRSRGIVSTSRSSPLSTTSPSSPLQNSPHGASHLLLPPYINPPILHSPMPTSKPHPPISLTKNPITPIPFSGNTHPLSLNSPLQNATQLTNINSIHPHYSHLKSPLALTTPSPNPPAPDPEQQPFTPTDLHNIPLQFSAEALILLPQPNPPPHL
ncbi:hypothetical protein Salat_2771300 [Sesamum alatum]|uniref:Zinc knuckle CX2CX4HX4C domain-containing protein n=1 Tax=Sesamum alatum TaxID=300844 RepID=A0AAE2C974_9LAMI|nr:hypothetical protein Salat_2771300 [Sesamum alatum]